MDIQELPLGFGMALTQDVAALARFAALTEPEQADILRRAQAVSTRDEMQALVNGIAPRADGAAPTGSR